MDRTEESKSCWFVARTRYFRQEIKLRDWLTDRGIECFVPTEKVRVKRGLKGRKTTEVPLVSNLLFVHTTKDAACSFVAESGLPMQYIIDCATHKMLVVTDKAMDDFQRVFACSIDEGGLMGQPLKVGELVRVTEGPLKGVEGYVLELRGKVFVVVGLLGMIWARAQVPRAWLEKV